MTKVILLFSTAATDLDICLISLEFFMIPSRITAVNHTKRWRKDPRWTIVPPVIYKDVRQRPDAAIITDLDKEALQSLLLVLEFIRNVHAIFEAWSNEVPLIESQRNQRIQLEHQGLGILLTTRTWPRMEEPSSSEICGVVRKSDLKFTAQLKLTFLRPRNYPRNYGGVRSFVPSPKSQFNYNAEPIPEQILRISVDASNFLEGSVLPRRESVR
ncbi:hypothetical protein C8J56DRAFT_890839 [Mycena floridula]|nr:hypothetical protein C8J56DRAFT_890839 [Mycena floridula]